jgi:hypothetical protein
MQYPSSVVAKCIRSLITSVGVSFNPNEVEEEAGVAVFLTQYQHIDLGIVLLPSSSGPLSPFFRLRITSVGNYILPSVTETPVPSSWIGRKLRLEIQALNSTHYTSSAALVDHKTKLTLGEAPVTVVSGGSGLYTGIQLYLSLLGFSDDNFRCNSRYICDEKCWYRHSCSIYQ